MRLTDASVAIRPRNRWEAMDLGILLARRHAGILMASWALLTLPVFTLLSLLLWRYPAWAIFAFWLMKPLYERLPLYILSRALFGDVPSLKQALKALPRLLRPQVLASLTWRRLSLTRSFDMPVMQLEGLNGAARTRRLVVLGQQDVGGASWLTIVGMHLEGTLYIGLILFFYFMIPHQIELDWDWKSLAEAASGDWLWLEHLSNLFYVLVLIVWEPVYVACGFTLYLNRRTLLEAWDIELVFRHLRQRLSGVAYALLLGFALFLLPPADIVWAAGEASSCPLPIVDPHGPDADRLTQQPLSSAAARQKISQVLDQAPFENRETVTRWRFGEEEPADDNKGFFDKLVKLLESIFKGDRPRDPAKPAEAVPLVAETILWALLASLLVLLVWRYRDWLSAFAGRVGLPKRRQRSAPQTLFGLEVAPESLPDDVASEAERLWEDHPREALGLLYRALLSQLLHHWRLPLKAAHTESEVLDLLHRLEQPELSRFAQVLTRHWQNLAYGHSVPPSALKRGLCEGWRRLLAQGATP
ncbi:MAG: DUF4129 domain-containing protein [Pseudomonas sp.]|uniref:DUF4129 domain-containing protein n=1 Tax=Pseudomonas sp. TaxID=306 RepID=UPI00339353A7